MRVFMGLICAVAMAATAGCATMPVAKPIERTRTIDRPYDAVWSDLVAFFATNSIPIRTIEKDSGLIVAEREVSNQGFIPAPSGINGMADCGYPGLWVPRGHSMRLNVLARRVDDGRTAVTVTAVFQEMWRSDFARQTVDCHSTGAIERMIHDRAQGLFPVQ